MKKRIIIPCILLFAISFSNIAFSQTVANEVISKDNVTIEKVKSIFEKAFYEITSSDESSITIKDVFTIYIDLDKDKKYLTYTVYWQVNESFGEKDRLDLLNKIGKEVLLVTPYFSASNPTLIVTTTVWIEGGNTEKNLVLTEKLFVKALNLILTKDTLGIIK